MKKTTSPAGTTKPAQKGSAIKQFASATKPKAQSVEKLKATEKPSTSTFMKKASKPGSVPKPAPTRTVTNPLAAKPKATAKPSPKPKPRVAEGQAELIQVVAQLAVSAEKLAQAAERLIEAVVRLSGARESRQEPEAQDEMLEKAAEVVEVMVVDEDDDGDDDGEGDEE